MKLTRLYSNHPAVFEPIHFNDGLSAILAEIRVPENRALDTHNVGKTTVGQLIDFCLLKGKDRSFFLFKHEERFQSFAFFLEIALPDGGYLTIGRAVNPGSKIDFKRSATSIDNAASFTEDDWDHHNVAFDRAKLLLDGILDFEALKPWDYRKIVGYLIRSQQDYNDVFQLGKFSGKHVEWKPFVAHLMGLDGQLALALYEKRAELDDASERLRTLTTDWSGEEIDASVLDGLIAVKRRSVAERQAALDSFDFNEDDRAVTEEVVERIEGQIAALNEERYQLIQLARQIEQSLERRTVTFGPDDAATLFREAGVTFPNQLTKDFEQLIEFNRAITEERSVALRGQLTAAATRIEEIDSQLAGLNDERASSLEYLRESDTLEKYKELSRSLITERSELTTLEARRAAATRLIELRQERRALAEEYGHLQTQVETEIELISQDEESTFGRTRRYFTETIFDVLGENAILAMNVNSQGGIDFRAEFVSDTGVATSGDRGTSYRKLLCIAFDLAVVLAHIDVRFPRFLYLDGALEQLEPRKREKLIGVFRRYEGMGIQPIISLLDSDLPEPLGANERTLAPSEVVLRLHDEGNAGLLFKMPPW